MITKAIAILALLLSIVLNTIASGYNPSQFDEQLFPIEFDAGLVFSVNRDKYIKHKFTNGHVALSCSRFVDAMEYFTDGLRLATAVYDSLNTGLAYSFISLTHSLVHNNTEALQNALEANNYLSTQNGQETKTWNLICLGSAYLRNDNALLAKKYLEQAIALSGYSNGFKQQYIIFGCENLACIKIQEGNYTGAEQILFTALLNNTNKSNITSGCYYKLGLCQMALNKVSEAHKNFQIAHDLAIKGQNFNLLEKLYAEKAKFLRKRGDFERSSHFYALADSISKKKFESRANNEVQQVTLNYQNDIERQKAELSRQRMEIEQLHLYEKTNRLKTTVAFLLLAITSSLALLMYIRRKTSCKLVRLQSEIVKSNEKQLTNYIAGQEEERNRISRDLHDGIGSQLAILKMQLSQLQKNNAPDSMPKLRESILLCDDIYSGLRNVAFNLMPRTLVKEGLVSAFEELACKLQKNTGLKFYFNNYGIENRLCIEVESALFRISQEITANIIKHSQATVTSIDLAADSNSIGLTISWNGKGFNPKTLETSKGFGWKNINTRLNQMDGSIMIDSSAEQDFSMIMVEIPLKIKQRYGKAG